MQALPKGIIITIYSKTSVSKISGDHKLLSIYWNVYLYKFHLAG